ncbi:MAG: hypothetical protein EGP68_05645 [Lachnospiraceae bacterium]|nr:hypothetical protein [Lachnospiraceae bacterium]MBD9124240.1 hypothetical protein [Lachnospiraceae bacterium]
MVAIPCGFKSHLPQEILKALNFQGFFLFHRNLFGGIGNQDICAAVLTKKNISFSPLQTGLKSIH